MAEKIVPNKRPISVRLKLFFRYDWWKILRELFLWINIFFMLFPLIFMIFSSFKTSGEFMSNPVGMPARDTLLEYGEENHVRQSGEG